MSAAAAVDRTAFIGGSDAGAILGVSPYKTPLDLWEEKRGLVDPTPPPERMEAIERGKMLEPVVLQMLLRARPYTIAACNRRYIDPELPFLACEVDAETDAGLNIEIKTATAWLTKKWREESGGADSIPRHYAAQVMHGLMVTGRPRAVVAAWIGDAFWVYEIARDEEFIALLRAREIEFWRRVTEGRRPEPVNEADLERLFEQDAGTEIEATGEIAAAAEQLLGVRAQIKELESRRDALEFSLKRFMGDAALLTSAGRKIATWKTQFSRRLDQKALAASHPDLIEQFKSPSMSRVFRLAKGENA